MLGTISASAADDIKNQFNPITTGVTSLGITPDARGASMGDLGVATDPDVNSQYWNPAKYPFCISRAGVALNYTPWLRQLVNEIRLCLQFGRRIAVVHPMAAQTRQRHLPGQPERLLEVRLG